MLQGGKTDRPREQFFDLPEMVFPDLVRSDNEPEVRIIKLHPGLVQRLLILRPCASCHDRPACSDKFLDERYRGKLFGNFNYPGKSCIAGNSGDGPQADSFK